MLRPEEKKDIKNIKQELRQNEEYLFYWLIAKDKLGEVEEIVEDENKEDSILDIRMISMNQVQENHY